MKFRLVTVDNAPRSSRPNTPEDFRPRLAITYGPVTDDAPDVAAERVLSAAHLDRDDLDAMRHAWKATPTHR